MTCLLGSTPLNLQLYVKKRLGSNFVRACHRGVFGKEVVDQLDHHAVEAGGSWVSRPSDMNGFLSGKYCHGRHIPRSEISTDCLPPCFPARQTRQER
jgi:hypothetical protein